MPERLLEAPEMAPLWQDLRDRLTPLPDRNFESVGGERRLKAGFEVAALDAFGSFSRAELGACGALIGYVELTQKGRLPHLRPPRRVVPGSHMLIDAATRRNLELLGSLGGERQGSLLAAVDRTVTGAGGRLLAARLAAPLASAGADPPPARCGPGPGRRAAAARRASRTAQGLSGSRARAVAPLAWARRAARPARVSGTAWRAPRP